MSKVVTPRNVPQYEQLRTANRTIAVLFRKDDCPACDVLLPEFHTLSTVFPKTLFIDINTSEPKWQKLADAKDIKVFPTTKIYKDRVLAATVVGASGEKVCENVRKLQHGRGVIIDKRLTEYYNKKKCAECDLGSYDM